MKLNFKKELQVGEEISVETFSRQESLEKFGFENSSDNIAAIEGIIENVPADSVVVFDEVPLESRSVNQDIKVMRQKASHDWSSLRNRRPTEVPAGVFCFVFYLIFVQITAIVCLQPISQAPTNKHKSRSITAPEDADAIVLTKQYRSTKKLLKYVNDLCVEGLPLEYLSIEAKPSHDIQGPEVTVIHITEDTNHPAFKTWLLHQMEELGCDHSNARVIFVPVTKKSVKNKKVGQVSKFYLKVGQAEQLAKATMEETKHCDLLATLGDVQGCEFPVVVVFFSNESQSSLLEMCSRAQYKLFLVVINNNDLFEGDALADSYSVTNEEMQKFSELHKVADRRRKVGKIEANPTMLLEKRPVFDLGENAPVWIPKDRVSACQVFKPS